MIQYVTSIGSKQVVLAPNLQRIKTMSMFNHKKITEPTEINFMGEKAYKLSNKERLTSMVLTSFLSDKYYIRKGQVVNTIINLSEGVDVEFLAKLALYARTKANMRSSSHLLASLVCRRAHHTEWAKEFYDKIVVRPDDMAEIVSCYSHLNFGDSTTRQLSKIPNAMKKGFRKALERLSPYQIDKYKMNGKSISLVDLVNVMHPVPTDRNREAYRRLMHGESLEGTYDSKILEKEMTAAGQNPEMDSDEKLLAKHDAIASVLEKGMPIMNLLRNLRNILIYAPDLIHYAVDQLTNEEKILNSKLLPFRFMSACDAINAVEFAETKKSEIQFESEKNDSEKFAEQKQKILVAIEKAMKISCRNIPKLEGNCAVLIDHSGSVRGGWYTHVSTVSPWSSVKTAMIGNLFGTMLAYNQDDVYIGMFGDKLIPYHIDRSIGILESNRLSYDAGAECGGRTENGLYEFLKSVVKENKHVDNLVIFSDMEIGDGHDESAGRWDRTSSYPESFKSLFTKFRKVNPDCLTVCCNINAESGTSVFNPNLNLLNVSGWSNSIFDTITMFKGGKIKSLVEEIDKSEI